MAREDFRLERIAGLSLRGWLLARGPYDRGVPTFMSLHLLAQVLWLITPLLLGGLVHVVIIKRNLWPALVSIPLDGGKTFRERRWFGENKTLRGALVTVVTTTLFTVVQGELWRRFAWAHGVSPVDFSTVAPALWGILMGVGYTLGELPNSFVKRQLDIPAGGSAPGAMGTVFWFVDQLDSLVGVLLALALVWVPSWPLVGMMVVVTLVVHPAVALLMYFLRLKTRIG